MKKVIYAVLYLAFFINGFAQTPAGIDPEQNLRTLGNLSPYSAGAVGFDNRYEGIQGSPYLFDDWTMGSIKFVKQDTFSMPVKMNVDLITQTVVVKLRDGSVGEITASYVQALKIADVHLKTSREFLVAREGEIEGIKSVRLKFYEVLHKGSFNLLKSNQKQFKKADYTGAYSTDRRYDEFVTEVKYWLQPPGKPYEKVNLRRKDIEKVLSGYENQVAEIIKKQKLNLNAEEDIVHLLEFLEQNGR